MAEKKIFTSLAFQSGAKLIAPKVEIVQAENNLTTPTGNNTYYTGSAGQLAYNNGNIWVNNDSIWTKLLNHASTATISGSFTFDRVDSNNAGIAPFIIGSESTNVLVAGLNADKLDGYDARNALNDGTTHSIPRRDSNNQFHVGIPTEDTHVVNKKYADTVAQGLSIKTAVRCATTASVTIGTGLNVGDTIDGVTLADGDRVLVKNNSSHVCGVYVAGESPARATDYDAASEINDGDFFFVQEGNTNGNKGFVQTKNVADLGTDPIVFEQFSEAGNLEVYSQAGTAAASKTAGPLIQVGNDVTFGYNDTHFAVDTNGNLKLASGGSGTGISSALLQDDAVTPDKLQDTGAFTMGGLTVNGTATVFSTNSPATLEIKGGTSWESSGASQGTNGNEHARLDFKTSDSSVSNPAVAGRISSVIENPNSAFNGLAFSTFDQTSADRLTKKMQLTYQGKLALGKDAVDALVGTPSGAGTMHVSTARYSTTNEITDGNAISTSNWSTSNGAGMLIGTPTNKAQYEDGLTASLAQTGIFNQATDAGKRYKLTFTIEAKSGVTFTSALLWIGRQDGGQDYVHDTDANGNGAYNDYGLGTHEVFFDLPTHASNTGLAFYAHSAGSAFVISNISLYEDTLSTSGSAFVTNLSVNSAADDLVIANNANAGMTIITPADGTGGIFFADKNHAQAGGIYYTHGTTNSLTFTSGGYNATALTLDSSQNAKFEQFVGINGMSASDPLSVKSEGQNDYVIRAYRSDATETIFDVHESSLGDGAVFIRDRNNSPKVKLYSNGTSSITGGSVAIGGTGAAQKLQVDGNIQLTNTAQTSSNFATNIQSIIFGDETANTGARHQASINAVREAWSNSPCKLTFKTSADVNSATTKLEIASDGTQDHKANSIVNSATVAGLQDGACYDFDGSASTIDLGDSDEITTGTNITVSAWIKNEGTAFSRIFQTQKGAGSTAYSLLINVNDGSTASGYISSLTWNGSSHNYKSHDASLDDSKWHHVAMVLTASTQQLYVDGVAAGTQGTNTFVNATNENHAFIGSMNATDQFFNGQIRDFQIFPSELDAADIRKLYAGENPKKNLNVELVVSGSNWVGDFDVSGDVSSWSSMSGGALAHESGRLKITGSGGDGTYGAEAPAITTTDGKTYLLEFDYESTGNWSVRVGSSSGNQDIVAAVTNSSGSGTHRVVFTATTSSAFITFYELTADKILYLDNVSVVEVGTLVELTSQSASSTQWRNEAIPALYNGTVNNATLSQGNSYWNNIRQEGDKVLLLPKADSPSSSSITTARLGIGIDDPAVVSAPITLRAEQNTPFLEVKDDFNADKSRVSFEYTYSGLDRLDINIHQPSKSTVMSLYEGDDVKVHGKLGVGADVDASHHLYVNGSSRFSSSLFLTSATAANINAVTGHMGLYFDSDSNANVADRSFTIYNRSAAAFKIDGNSNVAIGSTTPQQTLDVNGGSNSWGASFGSQIALGSAPFDNWVGIHIGYKETANNNYRKSGIAFQRTTASANGLVHILNNGAADNTSANLSWSVHSWDYDGTQDHKANRIVNSQTLNDSWRSSEPSLRFDGVDDHVDMGTASSIGVEYTLSAWVNLEDTGSAAVITHCATGSERRALQVFSGVVRLSYWEGSGWQGVSGGTITAGRWHHIVGTRNSSGQKIYIDGVEVTSGTLAGYVSNGFRVGWSGSSDSNQKYQLKGEVKDVRIQNRALDAGEIQGLYNGEATPFVYADADGDGPVSSINLSSGWSTVAGGTSIDDSDSFTTTSSGAGVSYPLTIGKRYRVTWSVSGSAYDSIRQYTSSETLITITTATSGTVDFTAEKNTIYIRNSAAGTTDIASFSLLEVGEVAAYTPKGISGPSASTRYWLDNTTNNNHGTITGATTVGNEIHGDLKTHFLRIGTNTSTPTWPNYGVGLEGYYDSNLVVGSTTGSSTLQSYSRDITNYKGLKLVGRDIALSASGTDRLVVNHDGTVKASSAASDNLIQVARVTDHTLNGNGSTKAFTFTHNLGTANIVVSVRSRSVPYEQVECHVLCNGDTTTTANDPTNKCTIVFATAPPSGSAGEYKVTVIG